MADFRIDADAVRALATLIEETGVTEIEWQDGQRRLRVTRQLPPPAAAMPAAAYGQPFAYPAAPAAAAPATAAPPAPAPVAPTPPSPATPTADASHPGAVVSPMVGTAYLQAEPGAPPFVREGSQVKAGDTLLIIEAMKVMNPIVAPKDGTVRRVLVADGSPVEYGELLMVVE